MNKIQIIYLSNKFQTLTSQIKWANLNLHQLLQIIQNLAVESMQNPLDQIVVILQTFFKIILTPKN